MFVTEPTNVTMRNRLPLQLDKFCVDSDRLSKADSSDIKPRNKDLQKTKLCIYYAQGSCTLGSSCKFAHDVSEIREAPNLAKTQLCTNFMKGKCMNPNCTYAHGEAELVKPPNFKKKMCHWHAQGKCRNGNKCGFAHDLAELGTGPHPGIEPTEVSQKSLYYPNLKGGADDYDASTDVPSSQSQAWTDVTMAGTTSVPEEPLFRMMAARGSAPLEHQVASLGAAIAGLQVKLSQIEGKMTQPEAAQMKDTITELSEQCGDMETHQRTAAPVAPPPGRKARPSTTASSSRDKYLAKPWESSDDWNDTFAGKVEGSRPMITGTPSPGKKVHLNAQASPLKHAVTKDRCQARWWEQHGMRSALAALTIALMVMVELTLNR